MKNHEIKTEPDESLNLYDLLIDEKVDELTEYLSLSIESIGSNTKVSLTTVEEIPTTYSTFFNQASSTALQELIEGNSSYINE